MISAFGVDHGSISKSVEPAPKRRLPEKLPERAGYVAPARVVRTYDQAQKRKPEAALINLGGTSGGYLIGGTAGAAAANAAAKKSKSMQRTTEIARKARKIVVTPAGKKSAIRYLGWTTGGLAGSLAGSEATYKFVRSRPTRYEYKDGGN